MTSGISSASSPRAESGVTDKTRSEFASPLPSPELRELIRERWLAGCPVWRLGSCLVPRVPYVHLPDDVLKPRVQLVLETGSTVLAWSQLGKHDWTQVRRLQLAVLADLYGQSKEEIEKRVVPAPAPAALRRPKQVADDANITRPIGRDLQIGRDLWRRLPAWPWSWFDANGRPPEDWDKSGPGPELVLAFNTWAGADRQPRAR
jgi:hypothetical protein